MPLKSGDSTQAMEGVACSCRLRSPHRGRLANKFKPDSGAACVGPKAVENERYGDAADQYLAWPGRLAELVVEKKLGSSRSGFDVFKRETQVLR
jgi:hypothetical protein